MSQHLKLLVLIVLFGIFFALTVSTGIACADFEHYASKPGERAHFGWGVCWNHGGNDPGYPGIIEIWHYLPEYVTFLGDFNVTVKAGSLLSYECKAVPNGGGSVDFPPDLFPTVVYLKFTVPVETFVDFSFEYYLQIDPDVPCGIEIISNVCDGKHQVHQWWRDSDGILHYSSLSGKWEGYSGPYYGHGCRSIHPTWLQEILLKYLAIRLVQMLIQKSSSTEI